MLRKIFSYRGFILNSIKRNLSRETLNSLFGMFWLVLNPLAMIVIYSVIFTRVMHAKLAGLPSGYGYTIYLCAGIIPWGFFSETLLRMQRIFIDNANLIKKVNFPAATLPIIEMGTTFINLMIVSVLFFIFLAIIGRFPGWELLACMPILIVQMAFMLGVGMFLAPLNVFFRDVGHGLNIILQFWFWFTPIVWPTTILPEYAREILKINPMYHVIVAYHQVFVFHQWPGYRGLTAVFLIGLALCYLAFKNYRRFSVELVDQL